MRHRTLAHKEPTGTKNVRLHEAKPFEPKATFAGLLQALLFFRSL